MKGEVPCCEPGIFPLIRHRHDIGGQKVTPTKVPAVLMTVGWRRLSRVAIEPTLHIEAIELLVPQHPGEGLTLDPPHVLLSDGSLQRSIEGVCLSNAVRENIIKAVKAARPLRTGRQPYADSDAAARRNLAQVKTSDLGAFPGGVHRFSFVVKNVFVESILEVALRSVDAE